MPLEGVGVGETGGVLQNVRAVLFSVHPSQFVLEAEASGMACTTRMVDEFRKGCGCGCGV